MVHLFDEPQFNPQDGYIGFMLDFFRKLRAEGRLVFVCLHPTASYHLEILSEIAERFLLVSNGGVTPHATFKSLIGDERCHDLSWAGDDPRRRDADMSGFGQGQVALVTGAAGSMGLATARMLADEGYRVAMADLAGPKLEAAAARHWRRPRAVSALMYRIRRRWKPRSARSKANSARSTCSINNAGILSNNKVAETTPDEWRKVLSVNLDGAFYLSRLAVPGMKARRRGRIVNTCSFAMKSGGLTAGTAYTTSKGALAALTFSLARETRHSASRSTPSRPPISARPWSKSS